MNREHGLQLWPSPRTPRVTSRPAVPVLIQVPAVPSLERASRRATARLQRRPAARRRRLRREVRMAGYTLMMTAPLILASLLLWGGRPAVSMAATRPVGDCVSDDGRADLAAARPPAISISIESATLSPCSEAEPPVVLPGYLLPDDHCEEPAHAGS